VQGQVSSIDVEHGNRFVGTRGLIHKVKNSAEKTGIFGMKRGRDYMASNDRSRQVSMKFIRAIGDVNPIIARRNYDMFDSKGEP
jgi:hypothetical protein